MTGLADALLYLVAPAHLRAAPLAELVPDLARAGVGAIQLREKHMEARRILEVGEPIGEACRVAGIPFIVNDRPDVALALRSDGVHLGHGDLPLEIARRIVPDAFFGTSTHSVDQVDRALTEPWDHFAVGPIFETPTKPGRAGTGLDLIRYAATVASDRTWFAIGGIDATNLRSVTEAGARRVVVVRAITEAADPAGAAAELKGLLQRS